MTRIQLCAFSILLVLQIYKTSSVITDKFGPFYVHTKSIQICQKSEIESPIDEKNYLNMTLNVAKISRTQEGYFGNFSFPNDIQLIEYHLIFETMYSGRYIPEFNTTLDVPCQNVFVGPILHQYFRSDEKCLIKKGVYKIDNINADKLVHLAYTNTQYASSVLTIKWLTKYGVICCFKILHDTKPAKNK